MSEITKQAQGKLKQESKQNKIGQYASAVIQPVYKALSGFCKEEWFAQEVLDMDKTLGDCCETIMQGVKSSISDLEVYKRAVEFYVPGSTVQFEMKVCHHWHEEEEHQDAEIPQVVDKPDGQIIHLEDLL
ncbi:MAG: hypothetical protein E7572_09615 [Ruminococcaceae bacterium]|nr:hypothetical protein [Oscillospiraceae bacterium]